MSKQAPGQLTLDDINNVYHEHCQIKLSKQTLKKIAASQASIERVLASGDTVYGINTGFGILADKRISDENLSLLQEKIILSHTAGVGEYLPIPIARLILFLKIESLAQGFSGVTIKTMEYLVTLFNHHYYPCIRSKGSVGASGDLAPLADLAGILLGHGHVYCDDGLMPAKDALKQLNLEPLHLRPKEGLALLNGTQVSTGIALAALLETQQLFETAITAGALSVDAARGSHTPFDDRIHQARNQPGQIEVAAKIRACLNDSPIKDSHANCERVQDPYCLRCQPQVMGACLDQINYVTEVLLREANAVTDNPLIFDDDAILSGGNFHAEPVAFAADNLALAISEIGALSERRTALLVDPHFSQLPAFLVEHAGLNSGFMMPQVTAAALASENKSLAHPRSVDSIPTSANQEDHVSMATNAALRLLTMLENTRYIIAIELLAASQGIELLRPLKTSKPLETIITTIREHIEPYHEDRRFSSDIELMADLILSSQLSV